MSFDSLLPGLCTVCRVRPSGLGGTLAFPICKICDALPRVHVFHTTTAAIGAEAQSPPRHPRTDPLSVWRVETVLYLPASADPWGPSHRVLILWWCEVLQAEPR